MLNAITVLDSVLDVANNIEIDDNNRYIASLVIQNCDCINNLSLEEFLAKVNINANQLKKFYKMFDFNNFTKFKEDINLWYQIRKNQMINTWKWEKIEEVAPIIFKLTNYNDYNEFFNIDLIDEICYQINESKRIILYGPSGLLSFTHNFQIDMKILGIDVIRSSMYESNIIIPNSNDFIWLFSMQGRTLSVAGTKMKTKVLSSCNKCLLITRNDVSTNADFKISLNTESDYYQGQYVLMFYLDVLMNRYYFLYKEGKL